MRAAPSAARSEPTVVHDGAGLSWPTARLTLAVTRTPPLQHHKLSPLAPAQPERRNMIGNRQHTSIGRKSAAAPSLCFHGAMDTEIPMNEAPVYCGRASAAIEKVIARTCANVPDWYAKWATAFAVVTNEFIDDIGTESDRSGWVRNVPSWLETECRGSKLLLSLRRR